MTAMACMGRVGHHYNTDDDSLKEIQSDSVLVESPRQTYPQFRVSKPTTRENPRIVSYTERWFCDTGQ